MILRKVLLTGTRHAAAMTFPWPALEPASAVAQASLGRLSTSIAIAQGLAASGRSIDLGGLESLTGLLCAQVMDLSQADGSAIRPELVELDRNVAVLLHTLKSSAR